MAAGCADRTRAARPRHHRDRSLRSRCAFGTSHITMAHGAGGKATQTLIEGLLSCVQLAIAACARRRRHCLDRGCRARVHDRQLRRQADPIPGRVDRRARRQRDCQRPGRGRSRPLAHPLDGARGGTPRRRASRRGRGDRAAAAAAGVEIVAGDTKSWSGATATRCIYKTQLNEGDET